MFFFFMGRFRFAEFVIFFFFILAYIGQTNERQKKKPTGESVFKRVLHLISSFGNNRLVYFYFFFCFFPTLDQQRLRPKANN